MSFIPANGMLTPACQAKRPLQGSKKQTRHAAQDKRVLPDHTKRLAAQDQVGVSQRHSCGNPDNNAADSAAEKEIRNTQKRHRHTGSGRKGNIAQKGPTPFNAPDNFNRAGIQQPAVPAFGSSLGSGLGQFGPAERSAMALLNNIQTQNLQPLLNGGAGGGSSVSMAAPILDSVFGLNGADNPFAGSRNPFAGGFGGLTGSPVTQPLAIGGLGGGFFA